MTGSAKNDQLDGEIKTYAPSGILIGTSIYKEGKEIESHNALTPSQVKDIVEEAKKYENSQQGK